MTDIAPYRWFIAVLADGSYRFITPDALHDAEIYIGEHGGGVYTHAGYLVFAASKAWDAWLTQEYDKKYRFYPADKRPPHIDVPNIECTFSQDALQWIEDNKQMLIERGDGYYDNIPRH